MSALSSKLRSTEDNGLVFWCPGCKTKHRIQYGAGTGPRWGWNGNAEMPTFTPSVLVTGRDFTPAGQDDYDAWYAAGCPPLNGKQFESAPSVCHSFVTDGQIQFLSDSTHALAGQTVPLPDFSWSEQ
jgi:hypothetical protein